MKTLAILLILLGIAALVYSGFSGEASPQSLPAGLSPEEPSINWPPLLGALLLVGGITLVIAEKPR
jgi:hypothetical protein